MNELDIGKGCTRVLPIVVQGTVVKSNYDNQITLRGHKKKHPGWVMTDQRFGLDYSYRKLEGKKVRFTIEVIDDE